MHNSLGALRGLFDAGARYMTLTHSCNTAWAQSSAGPTMDPPLTAFGVEVVWCVVLCCAWPLLSTHGTISFAFDAVPRLSMR